MKKITLTFFVCCVFQTVSFAQSKSFYNFSKQKKVTSVSFSTPATEKQNTLTTFVSTLPSLYLFKPPFLKASIVHAEFSFSDIFEGTFEQINPNLVNTYDDDFPELFPTPSFKLKLSCFIKL